MIQLLFDIAHVGTPPVKCQGIKTKLIPFIFSSIQWQDSDNGRWIEPFLGSGVVAFNLRPERALLTDTNRHIIGLYQGIQSGDINREAVQQFLEQEGNALSSGGAEYYYAVRQRFNETASPLDFLFLNRSCFNGVMRFNRRGEFNVPFGHKPQRFAKAYITKIVNQVGWVARQMQGRDWEFRVGTWDKTLAEVVSSDFVYLDPPYIGRHTDYFNSWDDAEACRLAETARNLPGGYALSMWLENRFRKNEHIAQCWPDTEIRVCSHFYHVGSDESLRNEMDGALVIKSGFATADKGKVRSRKEIIPIQQLAFVMEKSGGYLP